MWMLPLLLVACVSGGTDVVTARATTGPEHEVLTSTTGNQDVFVLRQSFYYDVERPESAVVFVTHDQGKQATVFGLRAEYPALALRSRYQQPPGQSALGHTEQIPIGIVKTHRAPDDAKVPDVRDKTTVVNLAKMTSDAYLRDPSLPEWLNLTNGFNATNPFPFGWHGNGLRGHVFSNEDNSTVVVSFKGTTINPWNSTRNPDRENDNVLFGCCCATQRKDYYWWQPVCSCRTGHYTCDSTCLTKECGRDDRYYAKAMELVTQKVIPRYADAQLWFTGHSLGGAVASLMGMKFDAPAVTFESPPERLPAERLGLTRSNQTFPHIYHFGNTADPIYMGGCRGTFSACALAGYFFETTCFSGNKCVYDTKKDKGWYTDVLNHRIEIVITEVLEQYDDVPECVAEINCSDCARWAFS